MDGEIEQTFRIFHTLNATKKNYALALCANKLISNDNFKLAQQLFLDSLPEDIKSAIIAKRNELKSSSFALPQTDFKNLPADIIHTKTIKISEKPVVINYVYASDIKDFNAYVHCPDVQYANEQSIETALNNFNVFETEGCSDAIICASYIGKDTTNKIVTGMGLILGTNSNSQHVFYNQDIMSLAKEKDILVLEYMTDKDCTYNDKKAHFDNVANTMKENLNLDNVKYIQFTDKQKDLSEGTILTTNHCKQACEELHIDYSAYQNCLNKLYNTNGAYTEGLISDVNVVACALKKRVFDKLMNGVIDYDYDLQNLIKFANERTLNIVILD